MPTSRTTLALPRSLLLFALAAAAAGAAICTTGRGGAECVAGSRSSDLWVAPPLYFRTLPAAARSPSGALIVTRGRSNTFTEVCVRDNHDFTPYGPKKVCYPVDRKQHPGGCPSGMTYATKVEWVYPIFRLCGCGRHSGKRMCVKRTHLVPFNKRQCYPKAATYDDELQKDGADILTWKEGKWGAAVRAPAPAHRARARPRMQPLLAVTGRC